MAHFPFNTHDHTWRFDTANLSVRLYAEPEETDPAGHFDDPADVEAIRDGEIDWFSAWVVVWLKDSDGEPTTPLAWDVLGCCAYKTATEFFSGHRDTDPMNRNCSLMRSARGEKTSICHYFPDMVSTAVEHARTELARYQRIPLRVVA